MQKPHMGLDFTLTYGSRDTRHVQPPNWYAAKKPINMILLLLLNEYYLHAVKQKSCKSMLQT